MSENIDFVKFSYDKVCKIAIILFSTTVLLPSFENNGIVFRDCSNIAILNSKFTNCGNQISDSSNSGYSIRIVGDAQSPAENVLIENCTFENSCGKTISFVGDVDDYVIRNNTINNSVWGAIDYWTPTVSGKYADVIENNVCKNIGFGKPSVNDTNALTSGVGCAGDIQRVWEHHSLIRL